MNRDTLTDTERLALQAVRGVAAIRKLINVEEKYSDTSFSAAVTSTGTVSLLSGIAVGDDASQRDGRSILGQRIKISGYGIVGSGPTQGTICRVMIVSDKITNGTLPSVTDILQSADVLSFQNHDTIARFTILWDETFTVNVVTANDPLFLFKADLEYNKHLKYIGTTGTVASCESGHLYAVVITSGASNAADIAYTTRLTYTDN